VKIPKREREREESGKLWETRKNNVLFPAGTQFSFTPFPILSTHPQQFYGVYFICGDLLSNENAMMIHIKICGKKCFIPSKRV
jgi:hypothetical protein